MSFSTNPLRYEYFKIDDTHDVTHDFRTVHAEYGVVSYSELASHAYSSITKHSKNFAKYPNPRGYLPLRKLIQNKKFRNTVKTDNIWITNGASGAFILICDILLNPGDTVLVEQYCYHGFLRELRKRNVNIIHMEGDQNGLSPEAMEQALLRLRKKNTTAKFIHVMSNFHNPTTYSLSQDRRQAIIELAHKYKTPLIENDTYCDFTLENQIKPSSLYDLTTYNNVIYLSSFTKLLGCSIRVGFLVAPDILSDKINYSMYGYSPSEIATISVSSYLEKNYESIVRKTAETLRTKRDCMVGAIKNYFPKQTHFNIPQGGFFLWVKLPNLINTENLLHESLKKGIAFLPGTCFSTDPVAKHYMRLCFSHNEINTIYNGIEKLGDIISS